jgi:type III pantothenate kinase
MLLAIDIGNTAIHIGVFRRGRLVGEWRITTNPHKTIDEYGMTLREFLQISRLDGKKVGGVAICSVVPNLTEEFRKSVRKYFRCDPLVVDHTTPTDLKILYDPPRDVGADRIVNAVAVKAHYRESVIIVDFGTATTYDVVSKRGEYIGGVITPGVMISAESLFKKAARLSVVQLDAPPKTIGQDTVSSVQSGVIYGYAAMVDGMVDRIRREIGGRVRVVATGGQAELIAPHTKSIEETRPYLTLEGLRILFDRHKT